MTLTKFTIQDINFLNRWEYDHTMVDFKTNLIIELRENYKLPFKDIGNLLNDQETNVKQNYYNHTK